MKSSKAPPKAAAKSGPPLPPDARGAAIPGSRANDALKGAPRPAPKIVDARQFTKDPRGGKPLVVGRAHFEVKDNRTRNPR
jgi:hypothetical protein